MLMESVLAGDREYVPTKRDRLFGPSPLRGERLRRECAGEDLRRAERLGEVDGELGLLERLLPLTAVEVAACEIGRQTREFFTRFVRHQGGERRLRSWKSRFGLPLPLLDSRETAGHAGCGARLAVCLVQSDRLTEQGGSPRTITSKVR